MNTIVITIISLCAIGIVSAVILYLVARKFKVEEDPRIDIVEGLLPGANCGGCGYPGCRGLAESAVKAPNLDGILCPVGGSAVMNQIAAALGQEVTAQAPKIAVVKCNGSCTNRPRTSIYNGARSCAIEHSLYRGDTGCSYGCLGCGDCVNACPFDAIHLNPETQLPEVDEQKCVACGACVKACPRNIIELRNKGPKDRRVFVSCVNKEKGAVARKACKVACIGCMKCAKECPFDAITVENNLAYIDYNKCRLCRKCVAVCPTGAIHEVNFPERKAAPAKPAVQAPAQTAPKETPVAEPVKAQTAATTEQAAPTPKKAETAPQTAIVTETVTPAEKTAEKTVEKPENQNPVTPQQISEKQENAEPVKMPEDQNNSTAKEKTSPAEETEVDFKI